MLFIFLLDEEDPLALVLKTKLTNWEFGTALVNCVEEWFLFNPNLGFKNAAKNIFRFVLFSIHVFIFITHYNREEYPIKFNEPD